ncbi:hypothetical protein FN846DRAFT_893552 [Sphaerosporella brunnea]|uniref:PHD-zinc-finger like domain-containing protein n=1 Tax=Sphaerosporella brunnea TaxID=1250544 RepID=A0A5J5ELP6_9PEZI|nr:hypothetical protein FN846DRAFT_893552 [Sphaerosporella brunnea]
MASTSPKATRNPTQTPIRGRGRGRPRLYARGTSSTSRRKAGSGSRFVDNTPSGRRRPTYQNGYRPGGAGGGGRYIHPSTGEEIPASVYKEIMKSAQKGEVPASLRRVAPALPPPSSIGPDGVYKPREERSYFEFHPGLDVEQPLLVLTAEEVDGENYKPPETKTVKILDIKEEEEMRKDMDIVSTKEEPQQDTSDTGRARSEGSSQPQDTTEEYISKPGPESATSPVSSPPNDVSTNVDPMSATTNGDLAVRFSVPTEGIMNGLAIDPALAALTPPPIPVTDSSGSLPIDPALAAQSQPPPAQTETPAATPTDGPLKDDGVAQVAPTPPPTTPSAPDTGPSPVKRGMSDVPTLASLRAHRTTAGKPPPRPLPPATARKPRAQGRVENPHEKLHLREPSFRKIQEFKFSESARNGIDGMGLRGFNGAHSFDRAQPMSENMLAVGYQKSTRFECPPTLLRDQPDFGVDEELGPVALDLVEYDMDEQDDQWLNNYNSKRMITGDNKVSQEVFEFAMTKIEKQWVNLERKMPKVPAKPHGAGWPNRRRSSGRAGEDDEDEGAEDSKCAICDDGECENANAIVFCDGCNLAVHQECYGVPYIPEGQWHCRKCQQIPRQTAHCVFCPNTDGAFKQTTTNRWAHLLCAIWIPEVRLANPAFMEPVEGVESVPKSRWKLNCYICKQRMGACIQCSNRSCFQAFHVTCGRRARLHMKMKNSSGQGALLESSSLKALCHKHVPPDWRKENDVDNAAAEAMEFYATNFTGREWGDSHAAAVARPQLTLEDDMSRIYQRMGDKRKADQRTIWKLPSGAPVIPKIILEVLVTSLKTFGITNVRNFAAEACKYWTLKREARRGASLVRRLQVQADSNSFTSIEVTRKNYASLGRTQGEKKLERRKDFAGDLEKDLLGLMSIVKAVREREDGRVMDVEMLEDFVDAMFFPERPLMSNVLEEAQELDTSNLFQLGFGLIRDRLENRLYPSVSAFALDVRSVLKSSPAEPRLEFDIRVKRYVPPSIAFNPPKSSVEDSEVVGADILKKLDSSFKETLAKEREIREERQERPTKRPRLPQHLSIDGLPNGRDSSHSPNSPSDQLVKEALPELGKDKTLSIDPTQLAMGGTILGSVSKALAKELLVGSGDKNRPPWYVKDYRPSEMEVDNEPTKGKTKLPPRPSEDSANATTELTNPAPENMNGVVSTPQDSHMASFITEEDCDMEDAPGDLDDDFLPPPPAEPVSVAAPPAPESHLPLHSDLHDEDAEGELDDELAMAYTLGNDLPTVVNNPMNNFPLPDMDSTHEELGTDDDLLGGYRPEDLPSPLGMNMGDSASSVGRISSNTANATLDVPYASRLRDPMSDLPDLPPNLGIPEKGMDHEHFDTTSVLSDYPEDLDENLSMGMNGNDANADEDDEVGLAENEVTPSRRSRKATTRSNGRSGGGRAATSVRKKRR